MKPHIVQPHVPTAQDGEGISPSQLFPGMYASTNPQAGKRAHALVSKLSWQHRHPHRNWTALSSRRVLDPNTNPSMKTNESKGQQPNDANVKGNPVCRPLGEAWLCIWNKGPPVTSSGRLIDSLASGFGHFSKPQVHPRAAKTTRKLRDTVYEREEQLPFFRPAF